MSDERQRFDEARNFEHVADQLNRAHEELRSMDYNAVEIEDDLRTILDLQDLLSTMCCRYRQDQHAAERRREERDG